MARLLSPSEAGQPFGDEVPGGGGRKGDADRYKRGELKRLPARTGLSGAQHCRRPKRSVPPFNTSSFSLPRVQQGYVCRGPYQSKFRPNGICLEVVAVEVVTPAVGEGPPVADTEALLRSSLYAQFFRAAASLAARNLERNCVPFTIRQCPFSEPHKNTLH